MPELTEAQREFMKKAGQWIKAKGQQYCPISAVKHVPNYRKVADDLKSMGLIRLYKGGETIIIEKRGWWVLADICPEIIHRRKRVHPLK